METIFVSYSRRQLYFAESVALTLQSAGLDVWFDLQKLTPGIDWATTLQEGYSQCDRLVLIASRAALQSPYVQVEWETALRNGREVILVLTEAVELPAPLRGCAVYDARTHFDRNLDSLIAYLKGEGPARHDPVPLPGKFRYPLKMPFDIWLTLWVMILPSISVWIAVLTIPPETVSFPIEWLDGIARLLPAGVNPSAVLFYLGGFILGLNLGLVQFPLREFWLHDAGQKEVDDIRVKLFWVQLVASFVVLVAALVSSAGQARLPAIGYLIFLVPLLTAYWSLRVWGRSPDILRWLPSGEADQDMRERLQAGLYVSSRNPAAVETVQPVRTAITYALHCHPADRYNARFIESILMTGGCRPAPEGEAEIQLILVSNRTSKAWLLERDAALPGQIIHLLGTNINTPPELKTVLQRQWVDLRSGRAKTLRALAATLTRKDAGNIVYGMQISPTGFDTERSFPASVRFVGWVGALAIPILTAAIWIVFENAVLFPILFIALALLYLYGVVLRKAPLPSVLHRIPGHFFAWFASPAPVSSDALGNQDGKYVYSLIKSFSGN
jgi:hypothetical protein